MEGAHIIEVNDLIISLTSKWKFGWLGVIEEKKIECPFFKKLDKFLVYEPSDVSIGLYHHKSDATLEMKKTKWESYTYILGLNPEKKIRDYLETMARLKRQIESCYANAIKMDSVEYG